MRKVVFIRLHETKCIICVRDRHTNIGIKKTCVSMSGLIRYQATMFISSNGSRIYLKTFNGNLHCSFRSSGESVILNTGCPPEEIS